MFHPHRFQPAAIAPLIALLLAACGGGGGSGGSTPVTPPAPTLNCPSARVVASAEDLVPGPLARGELGDLVIENTRLRAIVQKGKRNWYNISQFGGNIIDALPKDSTGELIGQDHYEEAVLGTNIESAPNYQTVEVVQAGGLDAEGNCQPAIIRATGPDDLLDFVNASSTIRDFGFNFPDSADDVDLPITIVTDYVLRPDASYIEMRTRLINDTDADQDIYLVEYTNGSGEVELFQYGYGFGEMLVTAPCDSCRGLIYAGHEGGEGVSYGILHDIPGTSSVSVSGVAVLAYGADATALFAAGPDAVPPNFTVPASGELEVVRYFAVAAGGVSAIMDIKHQILGEAVGTVSGVVVDPSGAGVPGAEIAVITENNDFDDLSLQPGLPGVPRGPDVIVANHFRTDARGRFLGTLRPGSYELRVNVPGRNAGENFVQTIEVAADETTLVTNIVAPRASGLRVTVVDENDQPIPAKVQLIGTDLSPDAGEPQNFENVGPAQQPLLTVRSGVFGDVRADPLAQFKADDGSVQGVMLSEFSLLDSGSGAVTVGDTGVLPIEPGEYQLSVSRGPRYSEYTADVRIVEGQTTVHTARLVRVVETPGIAFGDFHVHSFDSPDAEVTNRERVATYVAEDMDFFTPSDHGMRVDFEPVIASMGLGAWVASAPSAEITTFDYGHYNAWPVAIDTSPANTDEPSQSADPKISRGSVDWGGPAPVGQDFPSAGHFSRPPAEIFAEGKSEPFTPSREVAMQVNHVDTFFGANGLQIDTGVSPPQSHQNLASRRLDADNIPNAFDDGFDILELWIGVDGRAGQFGAFIEQNLPDWFNLLNQGILKPFVADSDTHERRLTSLATRNFISLPASHLVGDRANPEALRSDPHAVSDAVIEGYTVGSNAPFVTVKLENAAGEVAGLEQGDAFGTRSRPIGLGGGNATTLRVGVRAPTWARWDRIDVYVNGNTVKKTDALGQPEDPVRYSLCDARFTATVTPTAVDVATIDGVTYQRLETNTEFSIPSPGQDYWVVVKVQGTDGVSPPLFPVVPNDFVDGGDGLQTRSAADRGTPALAVTNPIYVDVDGDGEWTPPGVENTAHSGSQLPPDGCP